MIENSIIICTKFERPDSKLLMRFPAEVNQTSHPSVSVSWYWTSLGEIKHWTIRRLATAFHGRSRLRIEIGSAMCSRSTVRGPSHSRID